MRGDPNSVTVQGGFEPSPWQQGKLHLRMWSKALEEDRDYFCQSIILKIKNKLFLANTWRLKKKKKGSTRWSCLSFSDVQPVYTVDPSPPVASSSVSMCAMSLLHVETHSWRADGLFHVNHQKTNKWSSDAPSPPSASTPWLSPLATPKTIPQLLPILPSVSQSLSVMISSPLMAFSFPLFPPPPLLLAVSCNF